MKSKRIKMRVSRYAKFVEWSQEDGVFIGRCPELFHGGVHGKNEATVYKDLCDSVEEWIGLLNKEGVQLPNALDAKKFSGKFVVRIEPALHRRIAAKAQAAGDSLNTFVERALVKA